MTVSIVMAVYNGEKYLAKQLDSLLEQTYKNFEIYAYDDVSSDSSIEILKTYAQKDSRVHYVLNDSNKGYARNFIDGIIASEADVVFLSDQDDIWHPQKLEVMLSVMQKNTEIGMLISDDKAFSESVVVQNLTFFHSPRKNTPNEFLKHGAYRGMNTVISKKFLNQLKSDVDFNCNSPSHDWMIELIACKLDCMYKMDTILAFHRQHNNNTANLGNDTTNKYTLRVSSTKKKLDIYKWAIDNIHSEKIVKIAKINLKHHSMRLSLLLAPKLKSIFVFFYLLSNALIYGFPKKRVCADFIYSLRKH